MKKRTHKYGAIKTVYNGHTYASKAEAAYAQQLDLQLKADPPLIDGWRHGKPITLAGSIKYVPDFEVWQRPCYDHTDRWWVDVKGRETPAFRLKMRLWLETGPGKLITVKKSGNGFKIDQQWVPGQKAPVRKRKTKKR